MANRPEEPPYLSTSPAEESDNPLAALLEPQEPPVLPGLDGAPVRCEFAPHPRTARNRRLTAHRC